MDNQYGNNPNQDYNQQNQYNQQYDPNYNQNQQQYNRPLTPPKTWLVESILATIFCCWPFAVVGIVYAAKVETQFREGRYDEALRSSREAKKWTMWSFILGIISYVLAIGFYAVTVLLGVLGNTNPIW